MSIEERKEELGKLLKIEQKKERLGEIEKMMGEPGFWQDREKAKTVTQEMSGLQASVKLWTSAENEGQLEKLELEAKLNGEYDSNNAILSIYAGAGGTEAQDWAEMLLRMYKRYAEKKNFTMELLQVSSGEEAGIKSATARVSGLNAFGYLRSEAGVHRLVRMSPFDADHARHTSFALVEIIPEIEDAGDIVIDPKEIRVDVYRSSGHGGQSVNTTDSAVRITHIATGIVVTCQNERSQLQNRETALKILRSKLKLLAAESKKGREREMKGEFDSPEWGSQIRSYVLQPYQMVKDHRTGAESSDTEGVLNGDLDLFVEAYLKSDKNN